MNKDLEKQKQDPFGWSSFNFRNLQDRLDYIAEEHTDKEEINFNGYQTYHYDMCPGASELYGKMNMGSKIIYHKTTYNYNDLKTLLSECGFSKVNFYNWKNTEHSNFDDHSQAYIPHMDKENGTLISLNVEATK